MTVTRSEYPETIDNRLPIEETAQMIASDKVEGTAVFDAHGERIGKMQSVMIDKISGHVHYAVMSFGGFLGIGERYHPIPWSVLRYDEKLGGYIVGLKREALESGPSFGRGEQPLFDRAYGMGVYGHYGLLP